MNTVTCLGVEQQCSYRKISGDIGHILLYYWLFESISAWAAKFILHSTLPEAREPFLCVQEVEVKCRWMQLASAHWHFWQVYCLNYLFDGVSWSSGSS